MKRIMFNDHFRLTEAVLEGRKTMTRRLICCPKKFRGVEDLLLEFNRRPWRNFYYDCVVCDADGHELGQLPLPYEIGDVVAIVQSYEQIWDREYGNEGGFYERLQDEYGVVEPEFLPAWKNKMFVKAELMPHYIRITDLWFERLQDISEEDCLKEGIYFYNQGIDYGFTFRGTREKYRSAKDAFAELIDFVSHDHVWDCNPWDVAYTFELTD